MTLFYKIIAIYPSLTDKDFMTVITLQNDSDGKGDYIDGVVKGDQAQIDKYIADCLAVKAKYPKGVA